MFNKLYNLLNIDPTLSVSRSPKWKTVRNQFLINNKSVCTVCNKTYNLNVHHIIPIHIDNSLELEESNLIILCENKTFNCHINIGHLGNWKAYNPYVIEDSKFWNNRIVNRKLR